MNRYDDRARLVFHFAREEGAKLGHAMIGPEHLLLGLMREAGTASQVLGEFGATLEGFRRQVEEMVGRGDGLPRNETAAITPRARRVMELAGSEARSLGSNVIATEHILLGIIREGDGVAYRILQQLTRDVDTVRWRILAAADPKNQTEETSTPFLDEYARDLTNEAREKKLDPVIGRAEEIRRVIQILSRRNKNNPVLIGEPGVGKTAIVEGLAQSIVDGNVPPNLGAVRVLSIDLPNIVAGTKYRGEFEERLRQLIEELKNPKVIAFIDELHTLVGAGGAEGTLDAANILKPSLSRGEVQIIGATTIGEYHRYVEKDPALERRFQPIIVLESTPEESFEILQGLQERYEAHHSVSIPESILKMAIRYGERSMPGRNFPDKAIDLIDEAAARTRLNKSLGSPVLQTEDGTPIVSREDIEAVVSSWGGVYIDEKDPAKLDAVFDRLKEKVIGQESAIASLYSALRRAQVGLGGRTRVSASLLFVGPSGLGKTYLAKQLAIELFGSERSLTRLDMSEYQESHTVSKLIGAPPGYIGHEQGGRLTEAVRRQPFSVVLLDEIEKAHPDIFNTLLQVLDDGRLTDGLGATVDFRRAILIMTSNSGFNSATKVGFQESGLPDVEMPLRNIFNHAFMDRLDEIIVFKTYTETETVYIIEQMLAEIKIELSNRGIELSFSPEVAHFLCERLPKGDSVRRLRTIIRTDIEDPLSLELLNVTNEDPVLVHVENGDLCFARPVPIL